MHTRETLALWKSVRQNICIRRKTGSDDREGWRPPPGFRWSTVYLLFSTRTVTPPFSRFPIIPFSRLGWRMTSVSSHAVRKPPVSQRVPPRSMTYRKSPCKIDRVFLLSIPRAEHNDSGLVRLGLGGMLGLLRRLSPVEHDRPGKIVSTGTDRLL